MTYFKEYGVENLKPGDVIFFKDTFCVFLHFHKNHWGNKILRYIRLKCPYGILRYDSEFKYHDTTYSVYDSHFDGMLKLNDNVLPQDILDFRDEIMQSTDVKKKLFKWNKKNV